MTNEERIAEVEKNVYGGSMPAYNKAALRAILEKEDRFWEREAKDFVPGRDDGEPNKGDIKE